MKADYLSYKKATSVALLGLVLQLGIGLAALVYALVVRPRDELAVTGAFLVLSGVLVWLVLAVLFDLHRRERVEHMEQEALAATGARDASVFSESGDEFRVAAKRLAWMHRIMVPVASVAFALLLAGLGYWRYRTTLPVVTNNAFRVSPENFGAAITVGLTLAFTGFIFARYVAGMAKQPVWAHLRAGAGAAVSAAVVGLLLTVCHFIDYIGPDAPTRWANMVLPAVMGVLALEVLLNLVLGAYSPRRPGEYPRPAFDSKVLSFFAAPDRVAASIGEALNYQFGFDVTGNWFYQLLSRSVAALVLVGVAVVWLLTCVAIVQPDEQGLRVRMGQRMGGPLGPGAYVKLPWPLESVETFKTTAARRINLGGEQPKLAQGQTAILWTTAHGEEVQFAVRPVAEDRAAESKDAPADPAAGAAASAAPSPAAGSAQPAGAGAPAEASGAPAVRDYAMVSVELPLYYTVEDLAKFDLLAAPGEREGILRSVARKEAFTLLATETIDRVLGDGRDEISSRLRQRIDRRFHDLDAGVRVLYVGIEGVHPPRDTATAFENIVQATQNRASALISAQEDANKALIDVAGSVDTARRIVAAIDALEREQNAAAPAGDAAAKAARDARVAEARESVKRLIADAGGSASSVIQEARAQRWVRHMGQKVQSEAYAGKIAAFRAAPEVYVARTYFDTLADTLGKSRLYIVADEMPLVIEGDLKEATDAGSVFLKKKDE
jgi:regulator of protease activity HflC (stomatin/prohibitin superfamily)